MMRPTATLPIHSLPPGEPLALEALRLDDLADGSGALAALLPLVALHPRERQRLSGYLFPLCGGFVEDVADAVQQRPHLFAANAPAAALRVDGAALQEQQRRATKLRMLAQRFAELSQICQDLYLREQASGVDLALQVVRTVKARYTAPGADGADRERECCLWAAFQALAQRSPRPKRVVEPEVARKERAKQRQLARDRQDQAARALLAALAARPRPQPPVPPPPIAPPPVTPPPVVPPAGAAPPPAASNTAAPAAAAVHTPLVATSFVAQAPFLPRNSAVQILHGSPFPGAPQQKNLHSGTKDLSSSVRLIYCSGPGPSPVQVPFPLFPIADPGRSVPRPVSVAYPFIISVYHPRGTDPPRNGGPLGQY